MQTGDASIADRSEQWERHARAYTTSLAKIGGVAAEDKIVRAEIKSVVLRALNADVTLSALVEDLIANADTAETGRALKAATGDVLDEGLELPASCDMAMMIMHGAGLAADERSGRSTSMKWGITFDEVVAESRAAMVRRKRPVSKATRRRRVAALAASVPPGYATPPLARLLESPATDATSGFTATLLMSITGVDLSAEQFVLVRTVADFVAQVGLPLSEFVEMLSWEPALDDLVARLRYLMQKGAVAALFEMERHRPGMGDRERLDG
jgi:hypothetical protein